MPEFTNYKLETVRSDGYETLRQINGAYGFVPNLLGTMIESPETTKGYLALSKLFGETSFDATEQQVISLTASRMNGCEYCVAAHSTVADAQQVSAEVTEAIRGDRPIPDERLEALRLFVAQTVEQSGWLTERQLDAFLAAGFTRQQVFEVILGISMKTISNYINHVADIPLDRAFAAKRWRAPAPAVA